MMNLSKTRFFALIGFLFVFSLPTIAQSIPSCFCFSVRTGWSNSTGGPVPFSQVEWDLCGVVEHRYDNGGCGFANPATNGGFTFAVIDTTGNDSVWISHYIAGNSGQFGDYHCASNPLDQAGFDFNITPHAFQIAIDHFIDAIPNGCIIIMYSVNKPPYTTLWAGDSDLVNKLAAMGATDLRLLCDAGSPNHMPPGSYIFWTQKGNPNWHGQAVDTGYSTALSVSFCLDTVATTTSIADMSPSAHLNLFPNPSNNDGRFSVSTSEGGRITFYDAIGRMISDQKLIPGRNFIKIETEEELLFYKAELSNGTNLNGKLVLTR